MPTAKIIDPHQALQSVAVEIPPLPPVDFPAMLDTVTAWQAAVERKRNGIENLEHDLTDPDDKAKLVPFRQVYESLSMAWTALRVAAQQLIDLGQPEFPHLPTTMALKQRIRKEKDDTTEAEELFDGRAMAVSGDMNFSATPIPAKPE